MPTIMITGCSSGFGRETARYFAERGWDVVATMRSPRGDVLPSSDRIRLIPLDVTDSASIAAALKAAGPVDALINNAGIGFLNALEGTDMDAVREVFETNTFGTIAMMQAVLPQMRKRRAGVIVNVTSSVTYRPLPLLAVYTASKAAVNSLSDVVAAEVKPFGIRVHVVLPGRAPDTSFGDNARARMTEGVPAAYADMARQMFAKIEQDDGPITSMSDVSEAIWRAVTDDGAPARIPAGKDAVALSQDT
jgi:NAD(P)-dependent dehydrogenase (short-subunit alcohol dehydrogenase family)